MADEHIRKKTRYCKTQDEMSSLQADTAAHDEIEDEISSLQADTAAHKLLPPPEGTMTSPEKHSEDEVEEEEEERMPSTPIHYFQRLRMREMFETGNARERPNIFRNYHCHAYGPTRDSYPVFIKARDIIFVMFNDFYLIPFYYHEKLSRLRNREGFLIDFRMTILFACYNSNNNSLITVVMDTEGQRMMDTEGQRMIVSLDIESIKAGVTTNRRNICPRDAGRIVRWDFDIRNSRGMIYNEKENAFKFFELKNYAQLFTIRPNDENFGLSVDFGSPGNMDLSVVMEDKSLSLAREEVLLRIYAKHRGQIRKQISLPVSPQHEIQYLVLCGSDRIVMQQLKLRMQILDISGETSKIIKATDMEMLCRPYYLYRRNLFICVTQMGGTRSLNVFNLEGEIVVTFQDHPTYQLDFQIGSYITAAQDILISICPDPEPENSLIVSDLWSINISNILTGNCIAKITAGDGDNNVRRIALLDLDPRAFTYDETTHQIFVGDTGGHIFIWSYKWHTDQWVSSPYNPIHNTSSEDEDEDDDEESFDEDEDDDEEGFEEDDQEA